MEGLKFDRSIYIFFGVLATFIIVTVSASKKGRFLLKVLIRSAVGGVLIFLINLIGKVFGYSIPLNLFTAMITGLLEFPGLALILIIKHVIYPL